MHFMREPDSKIIGSIDYTHVKIQSPVASTSFKILDLVAHCPGSVHDQTVFDNSAIKQGLHNNEFGDSILIADSGYANTLHVITPLLQPENAIQNVFNEAGKSAALTDNSDPDWIPSLNMGYKPGSATSTAVKLERYKRKRQRAEKNEASTSQHHEESTEGYIGEPCPIPQEVTTVKIVQTDMTCDDITKLNLELMSALKIRDNLEKRVVSSQILKYDQFHLKYYTGLPTHKHFEIVINLTKSYVSVNANTVLASRRTASVDSDEIAPKFRF
nr:unnamed protein product [Callosobruchus chinensis]